MSLKLTKAYCCERVAMGAREDRDEVETLLDRCFGHRKWAGLTEIVSACNRSPLARDCMWNLDLIEAVLRDLGERTWRRDYRSTSTQEAGNWSAFHRRTAKKIDAEWTGSLDYC